MQHYECEDQFAVSGGEPRGHTLRCGYRRLHLRQPHTLNGGGGNVLLVAAVMLCCKELVRSYV